MDAHNEAIIITTPSTFESIPRSRLNVVASTPPSRINIVAIKYLSILQLLLGFITFLLGICILDAVGNWYEIVNVSGGLYGSICIIMTGVLGMVCTTRYPVNMSLIGATLASNVISSTISVMDALIFRVGFIASSGCSNKYSYYHYGYNYGYNTSTSCSYISLTTVLFGALMAVLIVESFVASITAIYCWRGCCGTSSSGTISQKRSPDNVIKTNHHHQSIYNLQKYPCKYYPLYNYNTQTIEKNSRDLQS